MSTVYKDIVGLKGYTQSNTRIQPITRSFNYPWRESVESKGGCVRIKYISDVEKNYSEIAKVKITENLSFDVRGFNISLPEKLSGIKSAIIQATTILDLTDDWDDEGANATNLIAFKKTIDFLINYSVFIYNNYNTVIDTPHIDILRDGSISAFWETKEAQFLIIFKKDDSEYSYFYGEEKNASIPIPFNRAVKNGAEIDSITALWMFQKLK